MYNSTLVIMKASIDTYGSGKQFLYPNGQFGEKNIELGIVVFLV